MILRFAQTVAAKLHAGPLPEVPLCADLLADWTVRLFKDGRVQWLILVNTSALLSFLVPAKGVNNAVKIVSLLEVELDAYLMKTGFLDFRAGQILREMPITFAKTLNHTVTGSVTDLVKLAQDRLFDGKSAENVGRAHGFHEIYETD